MGKRHKTANGSVVSWHRDMRNSSSINRRSPSSPIGRKNHSEITRAHGCLDDGFRLPAGSRIVINISLASAGVAVGLRVAGDDLYGHESEMEFLTVSIVARKYLPKIRRWLRRRRVGIGSYIGSATWSRHHAITCD